MSNSGRLRAWWDSFTAATGRGLIGLGGYWWTGLGLPPLEGCPGTCPVPGCGAPDCPGDAGREPAPRLERPPDGHPERLCADQPLTADELVLWKGILGK
ncbi:DUF6059 family protein [Streptomyces sp. NPDC002225]|uniref:DUF6059 family protein n=1 Tax=Streptomyces sp. NPDC002225 TaxID=3154413 RepID=UPI00332E4B03